MKIIVLGALFFCTLHCMEKPEIDMYTLVKNIQSREALDECTGSAAEYECIPLGIQRAVQCALPGIDALYQKQIDMTGLCSNIIFFPLKKQFAVIAKKETIGLRLIDFEGKTENSIKFPQSVQQKCASVLSYIIQKSDDENRILIQPKSSQDNKVYILDLSVKRVKAITCSADSDVGFVFGGQNIIRMRNNRVKLKNAFTGTTIISSACNMLWNEKGDNSLLLVEYPGAIHDLYAADDKDIVWVKKIFNVVEACMSPDGRWVATITTPREKTHYQTDLFFVKKKKQTELNECARSRPRVKKRFMLEEYSPVKGEMAFSFDGRYFVFAGEHYFNVYDVSKKSLTPLLDMHNESFIFSFSFDSKYLCIKDAWGFSHYFIDIHSLIERSKKTKAVVTFDELLKNCSFVRRATYGMLFVGTRWIGKYDSKAQIYRLWDIITKKVVLEVDNVTSEVALDEDNFLLFVPQGETDAIFSFANQLSIYDYVAHQKLLASLAYFA